MHIHISHVYQLHCSATHLNNAVTWCHIGSTYMGRSMELVLIHALCNLIQFSKKASTLLFQYLECFLHQHIRWKGSSGLHRDWKTAHNENPTQTVLAIYVHHSTHSQKHFSTQYLHNGALTDVVSFFSSQLHQIFQVLHTIQ